MTTTLLSGEERHELEELLGALAGAPPAAYTVPGRLVDGEATTVVRTRPAWESTAGDRSLELLAQLATTGARQSRMGAGSKSGDQDHARPLPFVAKPLELLEQIAGVLAAWATRELRLELAAGRGAAGPRTLNAGDAAAWLLERVPLLCARPVDTRDELAVLRRLVARGRAMVDRPADRWYAGPCSTPLRDDAGSLVIVAGAQAFCEVDLYAKPYAKLVVCRSCEAVHRVDERRTELLRLAKDRLDRAHVISRALTSLGQDCKPDRIRQWAKRDRLAVRGHLEDGTPLYRVGDVMELLDLEAARKARLAARQRPRKATA